MELADIHGWLDTGLLTAMIWQLSRVTRTVEEHEDFIQGLKKKYDRFSRPARH